MQGERLPFCQLWSVNRSSHDEGFLLATERFDVMGCGRKGGGALEKVSLSLELQLGFTKTPFAFSDFQD